jgi:hypothetical protein
MGNIKSNLRSSESEEFESATHSRSIDTQIRVEKKRMKKEVKLLLLGIFFFFCKSEKGSCT